MANENLLSFESGHWEFDGKVCWKLGVIGCFDLGSGMHQQLLKLVDVANGIGPDFV